MKSTVESKHNPIEHFLEKKKQEMGMYAIGLIQMALRKRSKPVR